MKTSIHSKILITFMLCWFSSSCEDYLEIDVPDDKIVRETVFENDQLALSALTGLYHQLFMAFYSGGGPDSVTALAALSSDDLTTIRSTNKTYMEFEEHEIFPNNERNLNLWSSAYNIIYMANSLLEGSSESESLSEEIRARLEGEAKFIRAFTYFYLVNLYGDVPLILSTDYSFNALAGRDGVEEIYEQVLLDLDGAVNILGDQYLDGERTQITRNSAIALLARVHLFRENWKDAELQSSKIISMADKFEILENLDDVFLKNSREAIWQLSPLGRGSAATQTNEAIFIIHPILPSISHLKLAEDFVASFDEDDLRSQHWIGFHSRLSSYYPFKYKVKSSTTEITEYSMVMRLAEQYLIRSEARANLGDLVGAIADLDVIRLRAGLESFSVIYPGIGKEDLLSAILEERKKELFTEWGHRWLDLKRTDRVSEVLGGADSFWEDTDVLYPIPEQERLKNPNLTQNEGY